MSTETPMGVVVKIDYMPKDDGTKKAPDYKCSRCDNKYSKFETTVRHFQSAHAVAPIPHHKVEKSSPGKQVSLW